MARQLFSNDETPDSFFIPEILGNLKIKNSENKLTTTNIETLYRNDGTKDGQIVWQISEPPVEPTDIPTDIVDPTDIPTDIVDPTDIPTDIVDPTDIPTDIDDGDPCSTICEADTLVHWPGVGGVFLGGSWNCPVWKETGKVLSGGITSETGSYFNDLIDPDDPNQIYGLVFTSDESDGILPPPPGYIMMDYGTYTEKDRFILYLNSRKINTGGNIRLFSSDEICPILPPTRDKTFDNAYGGNSSVEYYLDCSSYINALLDFNPDSQEQDICQKFNVSRPICICTDGIEVALDQECINEPPCVVIIGTEAAIEKVGGGQDGCTVIGDLVTDAYTFFDTDCISTTSGCNTVCYSRPEQVEYSPTVDVRAVNMDCRDVSYVPNVIAASYNITDAELSTLGIPPNYQTFYNSGFSFTDFGYLIHNGCSFPSCNIPQGCPPCSSEWQVRIFLPFYLNTPSLRYGKGGDPFDPDTDIRGKFVRLIKPDLNTSSPTNYNQHAVLRNIWDLVKGNIKNFGISFSNPIEGNSDDFFSGNPQTNPDKINWMLREVPELNYDNLGKAIPSHTHQIVIELTSFEVDEDYPQYGGGKCSTCFNTTGDFGETFNISNILLYPITKVDPIIGHYYVDSYENIFGSYLNFETGGNSHTLHKSVKYYWHPDINNDPTDLSVYNTGKLVSAESISYAATDAKYASDAENVFTDEWDGFDRFISSDSINSPLTVYDFLLYFNQPKTLTQQNANCNCEPTL